MSDVKVGDRVRIIEFQHAAEVGETVTVNKVNSFGNAFYEGTYSDLFQDNWYSGVGCFEVMADPAPVVIGDRIKLLSGTYFDNAVGDIVTVASTDCDGDPRFGEGNNDFAEPGDRELYSPAEGAVPTHDRVNHPEHYVSDPSGVECITITRHRNFNIGSAFKYLWRNGLKATSADPLAKQIEDLNKARWYIKDEILRLGGEVK